MANTIRYIIDYKGYGDIFDLTVIRNGEHNEITRVQAEQHLNESFTYFTFRADVAIRSVPQEEVTDSFTRRLEGVLLQGNRIS